jgi:hypothetical protein
MLRHSGLYPAWSALAMDANLSLGMAPGSKARTLRFAARFGCLSAFVIAVLERTGKALAPDGCHGSKKILAGRKYRVIMLFTAIAVPLSGTNVLA